MPHWALGNRFVTAAASRWAVLCRNRSSASGLLLVMMRTLASDVSGYDRSTIRSSTTAASAALASPGEIAAATSRTGDPAGRALVDPSGSVIETSELKT